MVSPAVLSQEHQVIFKYIMSGKSTAPAGQTGNSIIVVAHAPEGFDVEVSTKWDQTILGGIAKTLEPLNKNINAIFGKSIADPITSVLSFQGMNNPQMNLNLEFNTDNDAMTDVVQPVLNLIAMTVPSRVQTGLIESPGPVAWDEIKNFFNGFGQRSVTGFDPSASQNSIQSTSSASGNTDRDGNANQSSPRISVMMGTAMYIRSVVINRLNIRLSSAVDDNRHPIYAKVGITFTRFTAPLREDLNEMLMAGATLNQGSM